MLASPSPAQRFWPRNGQHYAWEEAGRVTTWRLPQSAAVSPADVPLMLSARCMHQRMVWLQTNNAAARQWQGVFRGTEACSPALARSCPGTFEDSSLSQQIDAQRLGSQWRQGRGLGPSAAASVCQPPLQLCPWWPENSSRQEKQAPLSRNSLWALKTMMKYSGNHAMFI